MKELLLLSLVLVTYAKPHCESIMKEAGLSEGFPVNVAHRLHSLTLEDLRWVISEFWLIYLHNSVGSNVRFLPVNFEYRKYRKYKL